MASLVPRVIEAVHADIERRSAFDRSSEDQAWFSIWLKGGWVAAMKLVPLPARSMAAQAVEREWAARHRGEWMSDQLRAELYWWVRGLDSGVDHNPNMLRRNM